MRREFIDRVPPNSRFFHPLPRDSRYPELPFWLDTTKFNGWDGQSQNGYFTRITLLALVAGHLGGDFQVSTPRRRQDSVASVTRGIADGITPMAVKNGYA